MRPTGKFSAAEIGESESRDNSGRYSSKDSVRTSPNQADATLQESNGAHTSSIVLRAIAAAKARRSARAALLQREMLRCSESKFEPAHNGANFQNSSGTGKRIPGDGGEDLQASYRFFYGEADAISESTRTTNSVVTISPIRAGGFSMHQSDLLSPSAALSPDIDFIRRLAVEDNKEQTPRALSSDAIRSVALSYTTHLTATVL